MAPPSVAVSLQPTREPSLTSTLPVLPTTTPPPSMSIFQGPGKHGRRTENNAPIITTVENDVTCGWYSGAPSQAFECSSSLSCATNKNNIIACSKKDDMNAFYSSCIDWVHATEEGCSDSGVLCCANPNPSCMTLLWTASPTRSLVGCNIYHSTWVMLDYPYELNKPTASSASDDPTSTLSSNPHNTPPSSSKTAPLSDSSQPPAPSITHSMDGTSSTPASSSPLSPPSPSDSNTPAQPQSSGLSTDTVAAPIVSSSASLLPTSPAPPATENASGGLSTGAKAGISVGASTGLLIILALVAIFLFKKHPARAKTQDEKPQNTIHGALQDNPSGDLPAEIAPPARIAHSLSTGWVSNRGDEFDIAEGASEVPVDMRGQAVGAVELPGSPVEMAPIGVGDRQFDEYQTQAAQYRRYSTITRDSHGRVTYHDPPREGGAWPGSTF